MLKAVVTSSLLLGAALAANTEPKYTGQMKAKGYRPYQGNDYIRTLTITQQDLDNAKEKVDWTAATSAVKDQGVCGSCWAYATAAGVETAVHLSFGGPVPEYSEQQIISCEQNGCHGCDGGNPMCALNYLQSVGGIATEQDYPDDNSQSNTTTSCSWNKKKAQVSVNWFLAVPKGLGDDQNEVGMAAVVSKYGPLSVCLNANWDNHGNWTNSGVHYGLNNQCPNNKVDHCVQLVGYDKTASPPYWKIRNSWGTSWGENGYVKIPYGLNNYCGVANEAYLIQVANTPLAEPRPIAGDFTKTIVV